MNARRTHSLCSSKLPLHLLCVSKQLRVPCVGARVLAWTCAFAAHAMRDGHHRGSAASERGRSVKDLKLCSLMEEMVRLWCWCEQIKGSQNEWNGPLSAVERSSRGTEPACFASNWGREEDGEGERGESVWGRKTQRILLIALSC